MDNQAAATRRKQAEKMVELGLPLDQVGRLDPDPNGQILNLPAAASQAQGIGAGLVWCPGELRPDGHGSVQLPDRFFVAVLAAVISRGDT